MKSIFVILIGITHFFVSHSNQVQFFVTTADGTRRWSQQSNPQVENGTAPNDGTTKVDINEQSIFQTMHGYGAALTQASASLFVKYKQSRGYSAYQTLLRQMFDPSPSNTQSLGINMLRLPITANDFTLPNITYYTYDDSSGDTDLSRESLKNDRNYIIPVLKDILAINPNLKIMACPWTAPVWMKTSASQGTQGFYSGRLANQYYSTYAAYLVKVVALYNNIGIKLFGLSLQNEPGNEPNSYPVMRMSHWNQSSLVQILGPKLKQAFPEVKLLIYEHNWDNPNFPINVLSNSQAYPYIDGTTFHCYGGQVSAQSQVHDRFPNKNIYFTECTGSGTDNFGGNLHWNSDNIWIGSVENWSSSVLHWNLVLDGSNPHQGGCSNCRGIFNMNVNGGFQMTMYEEWYGIQHFGKFIDPVVGAKRVGVDVQNGNGCLKAVAFVNNGSVLKGMNVVVSNFCSGNKNLYVQRTGGYVRVNVPVGLNTFYWT